MRGDIWTAVQIKRRPTWFLGAAASPFGAPPKYEAIRAEKKINAGAQFIQTQPIFDYDRFLDWVEALDKRNLLEKVYILPGLIPLKSSRAAHFMADEVPGVHIPPELVKRMDNAGDKDGTDGRRGADRPGNHREAEEHAANQRHARDGRALGSDRAAAAG
jgi:5,10-methylenetetrahydrofolate reductase